MGFAKTHFRTEVGLFADLLLVDTIPFIRIYNYSQIYVYSVHIYTFFSLCRDSLWITEYKVTTAAALRSLSMEVPATAAFSFS